MVGIEPHIVAQYTYLESGGADEPWLDVLNLTRELELNYVALTPYRGMRCLWGLHQGWSRTGEGEESPEVWQRNVGSSSRERMIFKIEAFSVVIQTEVRAGQLDISNLVRALLGMSLRNLICEADRQLPSSFDFSMIDHYVGWERWVCGLSSQPAFQRHIANIAKRRSTGC